VAVLLTIPNDIAQYPSVSYPEWSLNDGLPVFPDSSSPALLLFYPPSLQISQLIEDVSSHFPNVIPQSVSSANDIELMIRDSLASSYV
jgi:hypothetical protein